MSPPVCTYVRRQGRNAGVQCGNLVTALDPSRRYCCHHYRRHGAVPVVPAAPTAAPAATLASPDDMRSLLMGIHSQLTALAARVEAALAQ